MACSFQEASRAKREATKTDVLNDKARLASVEKQVVQVAEQESPMVLKELSDNHYVTLDNQEAVPCTHGKITITAGRKNPYDATTPY